MNRFHLISLLIISLSSQAEVNLDGTLGQSGALPGPDYLIGADLGQRHGRNLFHSFQNFNLQHLESATFSGPNQIENVISRVTGGNPSHIDGLIRSTIPNPDMYFLNLYGIMFGENAKSHVPRTLPAITSHSFALGRGCIFVMFVIPVFILFFDLLTCSRPSSSAPYLSLVSI
ncbi:conserved hypothetical protein, secreted [Beggiatoa sp. SS]|nr:conserved hypothetical protein, secreted [Beggiatoa sp. SS]